MTSLAEGSTRLDSHSSGQALVTLESDLAADGSYGRRTLEVSETHVRVLDDAGAETVRIPIAEIVHARNEPLVGGGRLVITTNGGDLLPVMSYSMTVAARFSEAARGIEQLAKGEPLSINLDQRHLRCSRCSRLLPELDGVCPACVNRNRTLLRIAGYLKPYSRQAMMLTGLSLITTVINLVPPQINGAIVDRVIIPHHNLRLLSLLVMAWVGVILAATVVQILTGRLIAFLAGNVAADLRNATYRAVEFLRVSHFDKKPVGAIVSRIAQDTERVWGFLVEGLPYVAANGLLLVGIVVFLFLTNATLAACVLAPIPVIVLISAVCWKPVSRKFFMFGQKWAKFHMGLNESLSGIRVVKAFAREDEEHAKFKARNFELRNAGVSADKTWYTIYGAMTLFTSLGALINWSVGGLMVYHGSMTLGDFVKVNSLIALVYGPIQWFGELNQWFSRAMAGAERIFELIDAEKEPAPASALPAERITGEVEFDGVRFGYDKSNPVLKGLTFSAKPGEMIGLVGKSGAGKSTTISLLCRFYEPDAGAIRIDGRDYRDYDLRSMRERIGVVLQEPFLFSGSIAENIAYGRPGAAFAEIVAAAKAANAHDFILGKPDGYDSTVGEKGSKLSGGERQRISIARAILHDPQILILDEATSSVDVETEKQIQEAIGRLVAGRTTFAIAHRLSTLRNATRLVVLEKGEIVEMGSHAELMAKQGVFHDLVQTQSAVTQIIGVA